MVMFVHLELAGIMMDRMLIIILAMTDKIDPRKFDRSLLPVHA